MGYKNKIEEFPMLDDGVEILFHEFKSNPNEKLIEIFLDFSNKLKPVHFGFKRLIDVGDDLKNYFEDKNKALVIRTLGNLYNDLKRFEDAEKAYTEALNISKKLAEKSPDAYLPDVAATQNNLGNLYNDLKRFEDAEKAITEALNISKKLAEKSPDAYLPDVAMSQINLGNLYIHLRRFEDAEKAYTKALKFYMAEKSPDAYLPDVATIQNNLGNLYNDLKRFEDAEKAYTEALNISKKLAEKSPDAYLPDVARTLNNLGALYDSLRRFEDAEKAYTEALKFYKELVEKNPDAYLPYVAMTQNNLGALYRHLIRFEDAEKTFTKALNILKKLVEKSPDAYLPFLLKTQSNIGNLCINTNRIEEGINSLNIVLKRKELLPDYGAICYVNLGEAYEKLQNPNNAVQNYFNASADYFLLFKQGVNCLDDVLKYLVKVVELGDDYIKGDAELIITAIGKLTDKEVSIPEVPLSRRGEALKEALNGKRVEIKPENEIDLMVVLLIKDLLS